MCETVSLNAWQMLKDLRSAESELNKARVKKDDKARLLDELIIARKGLSDGIREYPPFKGLGGSPPDSALKAEKAQEILDELTIRQEAFVSPFNRVIYPLWAKSLARSDESNEIAQSLGGMMYDVLKTEVYRGWTPMR
jgi:hypothetical protein